jgi:serine/threonine protein kinase
MVRPGDVVCNRYLLRELLGAGGMGCVYLADEPALARTVAIKILHARHVGNRDVVAAFREEAVAASRARHPSCVSIIECNRLPDGTPMIVMEHVPGRSLGRLIAEEQLPLARVVDLMTQILGALEAAHAAGVVHADVKSDNFLVESIDGVDHVTMIDFGLARLDGAAMLDGMISGTPEYMAPEVVRGDTPTAASDLYGAGVILYELLTRTTPFSGGGTSDVLTRQLHDCVVPPSLRCPDRELPSALDKIVLRALHKDPERRHADARELARALRTTLRLRTGRISLDEVWERPTRPEAPTRKLGSDVPRHRLARGSDLQLSEIERLRQRLGEALQHGDTAAIEDGYAALGSALARARQFANAVREIQEGIELLGERAPTDRLVAALSVIYDEATSRLTTKTMPR